MSTLSLEGLCIATHSLPSSLPAGFWSKAYIITPVVADMVVEVAKAVLVKKSIKAIAKDTVCFLFIVTEMFTLFVKKRHFT
jgi:hypothetical protein